MLWLLIGGAVFLAIVVALIGSGRRGGSVDDLGVISEQWRAQYRTKPHDPDR